MPKPPSPAVHFTELRLRNVRCFGDEEQVLNLTGPDGEPARWTVLLGDNGTGKTTVLECLTSLHRWCVEFLGEATRMIGATGGRRSTPIMNDEDLPRITLDLSAVAGRLISGQAWFYRAGKKDDWNITASLRENRTGRGASVRDSEIGFGPKGFSCKGFGAFGNIPTAFYGADRNVPSKAVEYDRLKDWKGSGLRFNAEDWLRELDYSAAKARSDEGRFAARLNTAKQCVVELLPDVEEVGFSEPTAGGRPPSVQLRTADGWVPLSLTAYGYQTLFVWVLDLVARLFEHYPDSDDPLSEPAVVLVDEIELHLHPSWQRSVLKFLDAKFPRVQWVVTTHSPLVAQAAPGVGANLAVLRRQNDDGTGPVVIDNTPDAVRGWRVDQVLASDLFDHTPPRDEATQEILDERRDLLARPTLSAADERRLKALEERLPSVPLGESRQEVRSRTLLADTLEKLWAAPNGAPTAAPPAA